MHNFLVQLSSSTPTPGGGSVSALAGALSAGLLSMVAGLKQPSHILLSVIPESQQIMKRCEELVEEDSDAYDKVVLAFKLPKEPEEEKAKRTQAVQEALEYAAKVPLETARYAVRLLELAGIVAEHGLKSAKSDVEVASLMARSAMVGALLNVRANTSSLNNIECRTNLEEEASRLEKEGEKLFQCAVANLSPV